mgnify:CR=1 FL=1
MCTWIPQSMSTPLYQYFHLANALLQVFERYFTTVPGSKEPSSYVFLPKDPVCKLGVRIPMRQGSLVLWVRTPHTLH